MTQNELKYFVQKFGQTEIISIFDSSNNQKQGTATRNLNGDQIMKTIQVKNGKETLTVEFSAEFFIIESNHGNHTGYNRKWSVWAYTFADAGKAGRALAHYLNDKNNVPEEDEEICVMSGWYDGRVLQVVTPQELAEAFENSGSDIRYTNNFDIEIIE